MIGEDDQKISVEHFKGLYSRGSVDEVPQDHAQDCLNLVFTSQGHAKTRDGLTKSIQVAQSGIRRFFLLEAIPPNYLEPFVGDSSATEGKMLLILDNNHNLHIGNDPANLYTNSGMTDFYAVNMGNRTFISPNNGSLGLKDGPLQVLNPLTGTIRDAAGPAPEEISFLMNAALSTTAGVVPVGVHKFLVIYETDTGFWTPPGPKLVLPLTAATQAIPCVFTCVDHGMVTGESHRIANFSGNWAQANGIWHITKIDDDRFSIPIDTVGFGAMTGAGVVAAGVQPATVTADGTKKINIAQIPIGPSYVKRRIIIGTRADEQEYFFIPNVDGSQSEISDNTTVTVDVDFDDTDLVASADYLFDIMEQIPGGSSLCKYRNRLVVTGPYLPGIQERVLVSNINDPETVNWVSGYIQVQSERDGNEVRNAFVLRDTLYLSKFVGTFAYQDNGNTPSTWPMSVVDAIVGSYAHGTSTFTESQGAPDTGDIVILASRAGLYLFDGVMRRPELSYKIQNLWLRINFAYFHRVTITHDPWHHLIFISAPLDNATEPNALLVCDYSDGRDPQSVRWCQWTLHKNPTCIGMAYFGSSISTPFKYTLKVGSIDASTPYLYTLTEGQLSDDGSIIVSNYTPGPFLYGGVGCFKYLMFRAWGSGRLSLTLSSLDNVQTIIPPFFTLVATPGRELYRDINFVNEKMNVKMASGTALNDYMILDRLDVWGLTLWQVRPTL